MQYSPTAGHSSSRRKIYLRAGKRCADLVVSLLGITLSSPILILCASAVKLGSCGPVLFRQQRVGRNGKLFTLLKFRTMTCGPHTERLKITVAGDPRVTTVGTWLRKMKLDELPQLFNVVRGDMSVIGPRPEVPEYVRFYDQRQRMVLRLKPGITGPASLVFINEETVLKQSRNPELFYRTHVMPQKLQIDLEYCERVSFLADCSLACRTLAKMAKLPFSKDEHLL